MKLTLKRLYKKKDYTIGKLYIDNKYFCDTLEDTDRNLKQSMSVDEITKIKIKDKTAIPSGTYNIVTNVISPKFKTSSWAKLYGGKVPRLLNVKGFDGILIHPGNQASDTSGCILVGNNKQVGKVLDSQATWFNLLKQIYNVKDISITIE